MPLYDIYGRPLGGFSDGISDSDMGKSWWKKVKRALHGVAPATLLLEKKKKEERAVAPVLIPGTPSAAIVAKQKLMPPAPEGYKYVVESPGTILEKIAIVPISEAVPVALPAPAYAPPGYAPAPTYVAPPAYAPPSYEEAAPSEEEAPRYEYEEEAPSEEISPEEYPQQEEEFSTKGIGMYSNDRIRGRVGVMRFGKAKSALVYTAPRPVYTAQHPTVSTTALLAHPYRRGAISGLGAVTPSTAGEELFSKELSDYLADINSMYVLTAASKELRFYNRGLWIITEGKRLLTPVLQAALQPIQTGLDRWKLDRSATLFKTGTDHVHINTIRERMVNAINTAYTILGLSPTVLPPVVSPTIPISFEPYVPFVPEAAAPAAAPATAPAAPPKKTNILLIGVLVVGAGIILMTLLKKKS